MPELERASGLAFNRDFFAGNSPERINPGDKTHRLPDIVKVTSGSTPEAADASPIRVAEAAKVIENIQRDVNIALVNELAMLVNELGLETCEVLEAAAPNGTSSPIVPGLWAGTASASIPRLAKHEYGIELTNECLSASRASIRRACW